MSMGGGRPGGPPITHLTEAEIAASGTPILGRIARMLKPYRSKMVFVAVAVVVSAILTSIAPFLTRAVFDRRSSRPTAVGSTCICSAGWSPVCAPSRSSPR